MQILEHATQPAAAIRASFNANATSFNQKQLYVQTGVGLYKAAAHRADGLLHPKEIFYRARAILSADPASHLIRMQQAHPREESASKGGSKGAWTAAATHFSSGVVSGDSCAFSSLSVEQQLDTLVVGNLGVVAASPHPQECFTALLSAFASDAAVIDVRVSDKPKLLNDIGKGIVQTNSFQQNHFPYTEKGLNGLNQVVGVADTGK